MKRIVAFSAMLLAVAGGTASAAERFVWRGLMVDEGRFFFGKDAAKVMLDRMAANGLNVFHWHLTEDQGWRLEIRKFPELTEVGAVRPYSPKVHTEKEPDGVKYGPFFYTEKDVAEILAYAKERGIRVVPEIEIPGHIRALLAAHPEFSCRGDLPKETPGWFDIMEDVLCAGNDEAIRYLEQVFDEVCRIFPDEVIHIGGDECPKNRWKACPKCQARIKALGLKDERALQGWVVRHFAEYLAKKGRRAMAWDEVLEGGECPKNVIIQCWRDRAHAVTAAKRGHDVVMSPWTETYLSLPAGREDRETYRRPVEKYNNFISGERLQAFDPLEGVPEALHGRIIGAEVCCWSEGTREMWALLRKTWPRAAVFAKALKNGPTGIWSHDLKTGGTDLSQATVYVGTAKAPVVAGAKVRRISPVESLLPVTAWYHPGQWDVIDATVPGGTIDQFMNEAALGSDPELEEQHFDYLRRLFEMKTRMRIAADAETFDARLVFNLPMCQNYNAMIAPMTQWKVRKIVWCGPADDRKLVALAKGWKAVWKGDFEFKVLKDGVECDLPKLPPAVSPYRTTIVPKEKDRTRLISWNIRNGMWSGQAENYDSFVRWVKAQDPDICLWIEASTIDKTESAEMMAPKERYLPAHWDELAARYGHKYVCLGQHHDNYPQVITSKYPIENVKRIAGPKEKPVMHGAAWSTVTVKGRKLNLVTVHPVPHRGNDAYRNHEMKIILDETIRSDPNAKDGLWLMAGDFNCVSRVDNFFYNFKEDDPYFSTHDMIAKETPYVDVLAARHPGVFLSTAGSWDKVNGVRLDYVYMTPALAKEVKAIDVSKDDYSRIRREFRLPTQAYRPSDHRPLIVDFNF